MEVKAGKILVSEPFMLDPNFKRSVVLICEKNEDGTTGLILNRPLDVSLNELLPDFPDTKAGVFMGGPVAVDSLHFLHNVGDLLDDSIEVSKGVFWGGDFEKLRFLMENGLINDHNVRFFIGYSGWEPGQLEGEMNEASWLVDDMDANYLFRVKPFVLWQTVLHNKGDIYTVIAQMPDSDSLN
ncbi:MAG: YqgE/AlgH family protein [Saprospiraceae bacterium]|nr:MAG: putative transcriptional regulator [Bacteroidetes bacterium OLB9]MCO6463039.1 YqgE/AlgH family protein [Saprospiraceae bacterium]MCZ2337135.1 YqgE/AlgH family protein [Chitinophagales bacterium]